MCGTGGWREHKRLLKYCGLAAKMEKGELCTHLGRNKLEEIEVVR